MAYSSHIEQRLDWDSAADRMAQAQFLQLYGQSLEHMGRFAVQRRQPPCEQLAAYRPDVKCPIDQRRPKR
ncbi:hypothetical protein KC354_g85 [Hortaea werneckii]|nr:hypothetical protein KC354_g85 [Hortaea werneckii]